MENVQQLRVETESILNFINDWQSKNVYDVNKLSEYNTKFTTEFNNFLLSNNFSESNLKLFLKKL